MNAEAAETQNVEETKDLHDAGHRPGRKDFSDKLQWPRFHDQRDSPSWRTSPLV